MPATPNIYYCPSCFKVAFFPGSRQGWLACSSPGPAPCSSETLECYLLSSSSREHWLIDLCPFSRLSKFSLSISLAAHTPSEVPLVALHILHTLPNSSPDRLRLSLYPLHSTFLRHVTLRPFLVCFLYVPESWRRVLQRHNITFNFCSRYSHSQASAYTQYYKKT